ncbi:MAG TPA: insulinase family protein, partial [Polyangia bacterium]|nr:insulinase family protein [Polyangia bacterium]
MIRARARLALWALGCASCLATTGEPQVAHTFPVRTYTMPSGLRIVVEQDDGAKLVGLAWVIDAGFADDPPARPGLAHLVEHLIYSTPDATGLSTWRRLVELGATENAKTEVDLTTAFAFAPRAALDELVAAFVDRAADPGHGLDEARLEKERRIVDEEVSLRADARGLGPRLVLNGLAGRALLADPADLRAAIGAITLDDVRGFIAAHYRPERMTLVLSGALGPEWDRGFLAALPGSLAGAAGERRPPARHPLAPPAGAPVRPEIVATVGDVRERELWLAWPVAPARGRDEVPLRMVAALADRLLARKIEASAITDVSSGGFEVFSSNAVRALLVHLALRPGADPEAARGEAHDVLDVLRALPIADWMRQDRRRANLDLQLARLAEAFTMESLESRTLGRARIAHGDPEQGVSDVVSAVIDTSLESVAVVVSRDLAGPPARSVLVTPRPGGGAGLGRSQLSPLAAAAGVEGEPAEDEAPAPHDARAVLETAQAPGAREARTTRLPNGLTVVVLPRRGLPLVTMLLGFHADPAPGERPGLRPALSLARVFKVARDPLERAILQKGAVEADAYVDTFEMFASSARSALDLIWDEAATLRLDGPSPRGEAWLQRSAVREATPDGHLSRSLLATLLDQHPYALDVSTASVRGAKADELRGWLDRVRRPANGVLVVVGDVDAAAIAADAADTLSDWSTDAAPPPPPPAPPVPVTTRPRALIAAVEPGRAWTKLQFGCLLPPASSARASVVGELFADTLQDELFRRLRVERAASYAPSLTREVLRGGAHLLIGTVDVEPKAG